MKMRFRVKQSVGALLVAGALGLVAGAQQDEAPRHTLMVDADRRQALDLNGAWHMIADPYAAGLYSFHNVLSPDGYFKDDVAAPGSNRLVEYSFARSPTLQVPGDWNTQKEWLRMYEGPMWYQRFFTYKPVPGHRAFLHIGAANYRSRAFVNGQQVCMHEGGFTPFDCEITKVVKEGENDVVIFVDNTRIAEGVPTLKTDWYNYGGLTRDVSVLTTPAALIDDYDLHLDRKTRSHIEGYVHVEGAQAGTTVKVTIPELGVQQELKTDAEGKAALSLTPRGLTLWSPETPRLYKVSLSSGGDVLEDEIGFRTVETSGSRILLNGKPIVLHGVSIHAEAPYRTGRAYSDKDVQALLGWAKDLGCNYVRLAHYPHDARMTRAADRMGILVWSEVPVYWAEHFGDESVFEKSRQQIHEMIRRDRNRASIILWSIANETPNTAERTSFLTRSASYVHEQDPTRLVTAALLVHGSATEKVIDDPLGKVLDVIGFNEYIGWYEGKPADAEQVTWTVAYDKPLIVSEFGGGAKAGLHGQASERWTEEFQADIYRHQLAMLNKIPQLRGMSPWVLMDFRSPARQLPGIQDGFNRKGLVSEQGEKKEAFKVLAEAYKSNTAAHAQ